MNDITLTLLVMMAAGLLVVIVFALVHRSRSEQEQRLAEMAKERGWKVEVVREPLLYGFRISKKNWRIDLLSQSDGNPKPKSSSNVTASTVWHAPGAGSTILIGPRTSQIKLGGLGEGLLRQVLQMALGSEAEGLAEVQEGSESFRKNFMIWAREPEDVRRLISPFLESTLMKWKKYYPLLKRTQAGLTIEIRNAQLKKPEEIETLVKLGDLLLSQEF